MGTVYFWSVVPLVPKSPMRQSPITYTKLTTERCFRFYKRHRCQTLIDFKSVSEMQHYTEGCIWAWKCVTVMEAYPCKKSNLCLAFAIVRKLLTIDMFCRNSKAGMKVGKHQRRGMEGGAEGEIELEAAGVLCPDWRVLMWGNSSCDSLVRNGRRSQRSRNSLPRSWPSGLLCWSS